MPALRSGPAYRFIFETATRILEIQQQHTLLHWLTQTTYEAAASKIMRLGLHYERNTWPQRHTRIQTLCQTSIANIGIIEGGLTNVTTIASIPAPWIPTYPAVPNYMDVQVLNHMDVLLRQGLLEIQRLTSYEVQYSQSVVAQYFLRPVDERGMLRRSLRILRDHIRTTARHISALLATLRPWMQESRVPARDGFIESWEDRVRARIASDAPFSVRAPYVLMTTLHPLF